MFALDRRQILFSWRPSLWTHRRAWGESHPRHAGTGIGMLHRLELAFFTETPQAGRKRQSSYRAMAGENFTFQSKIFYLALEPHVLRF